MKMTKSEALHHAKVLDYMHSEAFGMGDSNPIGKTAMESIAAAAKFMQDAVDADPVGYCQPDSLANVVDALSGPDVYVDPRLTMYRRDGTGWMVPLFTSQLEGE